MKLRYLIYITCLFSLCLYGTARAQKPDEQLTVTGKITDNNKRPLPGVNVFVQESKNTGVNTGADGSFTLKCSTNDVLVFQMKGYNTATRTAYESRDMTLALEPSLIDAGDNDNVYIPFGVRKKRQVSASVSTINGDALPQLPSSTLNNVLAGRLPGLYIQQLGTRPGTDDASFLIRGRSSYNSNQAPLVLVDGVQRDFVDMDLNEIESISVLKDAASLSWYGMYGANGIIYVRTKRGEATKTKVTLDVVAGLQAPTHVTRPLDSYTYATLYNEAQANSGIAPLYDATALAGYQNGTDPYKYPSNNFTDQFIQKVAPVQRYVATVSGGNSFARYYTMVSYFNQDGLYKGGNNSSYDANANFQRYNFRTNLDLHVNKNLDVSMDIGGRIMDLQYPSAGNSGLLSAINNTPPNAYPVLNPDGSYGGTSLFRTNPLALLSANGNRDDLTRNLLANINVREKLDAVIKGLSANVLYSYDVQSIFSSGISQDFAVYTPTTSGNPTGYDQFGVPAVISYAASSFSGNTRSNEFWGGLDYDRTFGKHTINFSTRYNRRETAVPSTLDSHAEGISNRLSYSYKQRYFADVIGTYSGSQYFAPGKQYGFFPAISAGWIVSDENFLKSVSFLSYLKLRGSYGIVGNDAFSLSRRYAYDNYYSRGQTGYVYGTGFTNVAGTTQNALANSDLTWERAKKASLGLDTKFFNQMLTISADVFQEVRDNLLTNTITPSIIGQSQIQINAGKARYRGIEGEFTLNKRFNKVDVSLFGNYTYATSKILAINEEAGLPAYQKALGHPIASVAQLNADAGSTSDITYISNFLVSDGIYQNAAEIAAGPKQRFSGTIQPGDIRYKDMNGDGVIDNLDFVRNDYSFVPTSYFGFGTTVAYHGFDLSVLFQGALGSTISINNIINSSTANAGYINQFSVDRWTPATASTALYPRLAIADRGNNTQNSDYWLRSGDYLRLKHAELGYTLPKGIISRFNMSSFRIYASGFNLLTFDKLKGLPIDPEIPMAGYNTSYPYLRTFSLGINAKF
ncbi:MAG: TonB-dependent receptor [Mucilaginibacter sp.]|uniref:SusC/RagA family TonB-linked outer membrane protein n=1 Tax=Mucilaginibacter sp. TaxID=1882438 RepID=UPI003264C561